MTLEQFNAAVDLATMIYVRPSNGHPFYESTKEAAKEWGRVSVQNQLRPPRVWSEHQVLLIACESHVGEPLTQ